jgi:hypothetical protein
VLLEDWLQVKQCWSWANVLQLLKHFSLFVS